VAKREKPEGPNREEPKMSDTIEIRPTAQSFADYIASKGYDVDATTVELTFVFHAEWQSSPERKAERENAKAERANAVNAAKAKRDAERVERAKAEKAKLEAKLQKLTAPSEPTKK
jgi:hypothetical protein